MRLLSFIVLTLGLAGCERVAADRADAQLVARVNGIEISAREIRTSASPSVAQAVEKVIDRELLVQKALEAGPRRDWQGKGSTGNARPPGPARGRPDRAATAPTPTPKDEG